MKLIVYVLSALLLFSSVSAGETSSQQQQVDLSQLDIDSNLSNSLKDGINWIFQQAANKYDISDSNIQVTKVNGITKWEDNGDTYYSFDVEATNNDDATIQSTYTIRCGSDSEDDKKVTKWSYHIDYKSNQSESENMNNNIEDTQENNNEEECEITDAGENVEIDVNVEVDVSVEEDTNDKCEQGSEVDASEIENDSHLKSALVHGINWIFQQASDKFDILNSNIEVTQVNCICKWEDNRNTYYSFDVEATNNEDDIVDASYNVKCESESGDLRVVNEWKYNIHYKNKDNSGETETEVEVCENGEYESTEIGNYEDDVEIDIEINIEINTNTNTNGENEEGVIYQEEGEAEENSEDDEYHLLDSSECETDEIKNMIDQAIEYVTEKETDKIPKDDYYLKDIVSVSKKSTDNGDWYKCEVNVENNDGSTKLNLKFDSEAKDAECDVKSYSYDISTSN